jgi:hypothetical protein
MPTHALITHPTSRKTTLQTIEVVLHPITIISLWLPGCWLMHELVSVMSLMEMDLVNSLERFQASLFITR